MKKFKLKGKAFKRMCARQEARFTWGPLEQVELLNACEKISQSLAASLCEDKRKAKRQKRKADRLARIFIPDGPSLLDTDESLEVFIKRVRHIPEGSYTGKNPEPHNCIFNRCDRMPKAEIVKTDLTEESLEAVIAEIAEIAEIAGSREL